MLTLTGKMKDGKVVKTRKPGISVMSPQFGTTSKDKRMQKKAWEKEMVAAATTGKTLKNGRFQDTIGQLVANTTDMEEEEDEAVFSAPVFDYTDEHGSNEQKAFSIIQKKYEQNLTVVEKLYHEKQTLEEYTKSLEKQLETLTGSKIVHSPLQSFNNSFDESFDHVGDQNLPSPIERPKPSKDPYDSLNKIKHGSGGHTFTAEELAALMDDGPRHRGRSLKAASTDSFVRSRSAGKYRTSASPASTRGAPRRAQDDNFHQLNQSRSSDHLSVSSRSAGVSRHLQADIDRFVQKRKLQQERDKLIKMQQENYERQLKERQLRASLNARDFSEMRRREQEAQERQRLRYLKNQEKELELEREKEAMERQKRALQIKRAKEELQTKANMTWEELQMEEEKARKERIERRKQELAMMSSLPKSIEENIQKMTSKLSRDKMKEKEHQLSAGASLTLSASGHRSLEPSEVTERLKRQQDKWEQRLSREREKSQERRQSSGNALSASGPVDLLASMERREKETREKREQRLKQQREREALEKQQKAAKERAKKEKLLSLQLPASALKSTKAEELRQRKLAQERLAQEQARQREAKKMADKELSLKETQAVLSVQLQHRRDKLKEKNPGYVELMNSQAADKLLAERVKQAKQEYNQKLRENKRRIEENVKKNRLSLMERLDKDIAVRNARTNALMTVAKAVESAGYGDDDDDDYGEGKDDDSLGGRHTGRKASRGGRSIEDEIFEPMEQLKLGIK